MESNEPAARPGDGTYEEMTGGQGELGAAAATGAAPAPVDRAR